MLHMFAFDSLPILAQGFVSVAASKAPPNPRLIRSPRDASSARTMMDSAFVLACAGLNFPEQFQELLTQKGSLLLEDFALMAATETDIKTENIDWSKAAGVELVEVKDQIAVKKHWIAARKSNVGSSSVSSGDAAAEEGIPKEPASDLLAMWKQKHGFTRPDTWLVSATNQKTIWKKVNATPPEVEILLVEQLRMHSQRSRIFGTFLNCVPGQSVQASSVDVDSVHMPMAFVAIRKSDWFDFQTAIFAAEKIQDLVLTTNGGAIPPVEHFNDAWTATINFFSEQVRITSQSLKAVVNNTEGWENKWQWKGRNSVPVAQDLPPHVAQNASAVKEFARRQEQAQRDKQRQRESNSALEAVRDLGLQCKGGSTGKYSGGKGSYKGNNDDPNYQSRRNDNKNNGGGRRNLDNERRRNPDNNCDRSRRRF